MPATTDCHISQSHGKYKKEIPIILSNFKKIGEGGVKICVETPPPKKKKKKKKKNTNNNNNNKKQQQQKKHPQTNKKTKNKTPKTPTTLDIATGISVTEYKDA